MSKFETKNAILTKKLNNIIYELMIKTKAEMVYTDDDTTLTEVLSDIGDALSSHTRSFEEILIDIKNIVENTESIEEDLKTIWNYVNVDGDPKSALIKMIESKQSAEEGRGLSECDFTTVLKEKLENGYSKEDLDRKFKIIIEDIDRRVPEGLVHVVEELKSAPTASLVTADEKEAEKLNNGSIWYKIIVR